jgi:uncharacterized lipoprotein YmbA
MQSLDRIAKLLLLMAMLSLAACSSAAARFYTLSAGAAPVSSARSDISVMIGPFEIPGYLDRPQIVTRAGDAQLKFAEFDRWAEPLDQSITRTVWKNVRTLLDSDSVYDFPLKSVFVYDYQVAARVRRFDAGPSGVAILELQWSLFDKRAHQIIGEPRVSRYEEAAGSDSYADIVAALNRTLTRFSQDVADVLRSLPRRAPVTLEN